MNDRLLKLYESAHIVNGQLTDRLDIEKFAQLIVRECADVATINAHQWASPGTYVLKHFGVELDVNETLRNRSTYFGNDI